MRKTSTRLPEQGTQTPSPAPDLIPAETNNQPRTHIAIGTANGGTSRAARHGGRYLPPPPTKIQGLQRIQSTWVNKSLSRITTATIRPW